MLQPLSCLDQWGGEAGWQARAFLGSSRLCLTQRGKLRPREGRDSLQALSGLTSGLGLGGKLAGASQDGGGSAEKALACIRDTGVAGCREKPGASGPWGPYTTGWSFHVGIGKSWEVAGLLGTQQAKPAALQPSHPAGPGYLASLLTAEYPLCAEVGVRGSGVTLGRGLAGLNINQPQALNLTILKNEMASWISRRCSELWRALL